jgi:predicted nucleic acid-binding protein
VLLIDTNVFLEGLLTQSSAALCRKFLDSHAGSVCMSDFSLHSIGIMLFRLKRDDLFDTFLRGVLPAVPVVSLPLSRYSRLAEIRANAGFDFDDAYQCAIAEALNLPIVTMDRDFDRVRHLVEVVSPLE